ncbi:hypothetical protein [Niallia endozanthoxylica]|uniref:hypothetical protein n=1 Tax=Niallia endozanthoxylica TaxID=2036016 RepID=UPI00168BF45D|nr:hypothetical protein [Niallia endozanthoxylica]
MKGQKVVYNNENYTVLHDYGNGQIEIQKENSKFFGDAKLVKKEEVLIINNEWNKSGL